MTFRHQGTENETKRYLVIQQYKYHKRNEMDSMQKCTKPQHKFRLNPQNAQLLRKVHNLYTFDFIEPQEYDETQLQLLI